MRDAMLIPGELAPIVRRIFELRAAGTNPSGTRIHAF
jgi:hypothetical protein